MGKKYVGYFSIFLLLHSTKNMTEKIGFLFSHGYGSNKEQIGWYAPGNVLKWSILQKPYYSFDFPEVGPYGTIIQSKVALAQTADIESLSNACIKVKEQNNLDLLVLVGVSRGAATSINYLCIKGAQLIKAAVLECPFARYSSIEHLFSPAAKIINPLDPYTLITSSALTIPILLVHSQKDTLIPIKDSRELYAALKKSGNKDVYLLELTQGAHANCQSGSEGRKYEACVHAFYKKYGIPHDATLASQGTKYLEQAQL